MKHSITPIVTPTPQKTSLSELLRNLIFKPTPNEHEALQKSDNLPDNAEENYDTDEDFLPRRLETIPENEVLNFRSYSASPGRANPSPCKNRELHCSHSILLPDKEISLKEILVEEGPFRSEMDVNYFRNNLNINTSLANITARNIEDLSWDMFFPNQESGETDKPIDYGGGNNYFLYNGEESK